MGVGGTKLSKTEVELVDQLKYAREADIASDTRYGFQVRIYKQISSVQRVAIIEKVCDNEILFQAFLDAQMKIKYLSHSGMINLINLASKSKSSYLCSKFFKVKLLYDYVSKDLEENIAQRIEFQKESIRLNLSSTTAYFEEEEIWYILATVAAVLAYLEQHEIYHGDIRPSNLGLTQDGVLKLVGVNSLLQTGWSSFQEKLEGLETNSTYISPIQLSALEHRVMSPVHQIAKSDIFCLGVIALECCLLESVQSIYDFKTYKINVSSHVKKLRETNRYSSKLIETISDILNLEESSRYSPEELYEHILSLAEEELIQISRKIDTLSLVQQVLEQHKEEVKEKDLLKAKREIVEDLLQLPEKTDFGLLREIESEQPNQEDGEVVEGSLIRQIQEKLQSQVIELEKEKFNPPVSEIRMQSTHKDEDKSNPPNDLNYDPLVQQRTRPFSEHHENSISQQNNHQAQQYSPQTQQNLFQTQQNSPQNSKKHWGMIRSQQQTQHEQHNNKLKMFQMAAQQLQQQQQQKFQQQIQQQLQLQIQQQLQMLEQVKALQSQQELFAPLQQPQQEEAEMMDLLQQNPEMVQELILTQQNVGQGQMNNTSGFASRTSPRDHQTLQNQQIQDGQYEQQQQQQQYQQFNFIQQNSQFSQNGFNSNTNNNFVATNSQDHQSNHIVGKGVNLFANNIAQSVAQQGIKRSIFGNNLLSSAIKTQTSQIQPQNMNNPLFQQFSNINNNQILGQSQSSIHNAPSSGFNNNNSNMVQGINPINTASNSAYYQNEQNYNNNNNTAQGGFLKLLSDQKDK